MNKTVIFSGGGIHADRSADRRPSGRPGASDVVNHPFTGRAAAASARPRHGISPDHQ